ncbi:hypothetical protein ABPG77_009061 [Micractinium sp. CCAP 211/92]
MAHQRRRQRALAAAQSPRTSQAAPARCEACSATPAATPQARTSQTHRSTAPPPPGAAASSSAATCIVSPAQQARLASPASQSGVAPAARPLTSPTIPCASATLSVTSTPQPLPAVAPALAATTAIPLPATPLALAPTTIAISAAALPSPAHPGVPGFHNSTCQLHSHGRAVQCTLVGLRFPCSSCQQMLLSLPLTPSSALTTAVSATQEAPAATACCASCSFASRAEHPQTPVALMTTAAAA